MKIAIVYDMIYPFHIGGAEYRNFRVAKLLAKSGHDIHLVGVKLWDGPDTIRRNGITLHGICRYKDLYGFGGNRSIIEIYKFARACYSFFKKNEFDVIDSASFCFLHNFALKAVLPKKTKYIMTWHQYFGSYWFSYTNPIIAACAYILENLNLKLTSTHTCVSTTTQKQLKKKGVLAKHIPNGIEVQEIKKYDGKKDIDILFVGRLHFQKNVFLLLNSIVALREKQPDITCTIIGDGPELKKIEKFIQQHSLSKNITLKKNTKDHDELYRYYQRAKIFAFPSLLEGFAIVSLEAMACGLPIVTIDAPQNHAKETIGSGALYASNTISDFSQKIQILLNDKKMYQRMKNENLKRAQSYSWTKATRLLERLYSSRI